MLKAFLALVVLAAGAAAAAWFGYVAPGLHDLEVDGHRVAIETLVIPAGANTRQVAALMQKQELLRDARFFYYFARAKKLGAPKSGEYEIPETASALAIWDKFVRGEVVQYEIAFPEGLTFREIAKRLEGSVLLKPAELLQLCEDKAFLAAQKVEADDCEGYLFPDTYKFAKGRAPAEIVATIIKRHFDVFAKDIEPKRANTGMSHHQLLTLASIVEKETAAEEERPRIARVFLNRLKLKMPLGTDPTVIYSQLKLHGTFDGNLKREHLLADIPYNTYKRAGLPPGPISNPGLKAMQAVVDPTAGNDLYFVSRNDGHHVFCPTLQCHEENVKKWQVEYFRNKRAQKKR